MGSSLKEYKHAETIDRLADSCVMLERLPSVLSRAMRNPLSTILLHLDLLEDDLQRPTADSRGRLLEALENIETELARLSRLVQDASAVVHQAGSHDCGVT